MKRAAQSAAQKIETGFLDRSIMFEKSERRRVVRAPREFGRKQTHAAVAARRGVAKAAKRLRRRSTNQ